MKVIGASLLALLLGVAAGWQWNDPEQAAGARSEEVPKPPARSPSLERVAELKGRVAVALGEGWRDWAGRIEAAESQEELEGLFAELMATEDQTLFTTVGRLLAARWAEVAPASALRFLWKAKNATWVLHPMLAEWVLRDQAAALAGLDEVAPKTDYRVKEEILKQLVKRDPDATLEFMRATRRYVRYLEDYDAWRKLARARPQEFATLITELETEHLKAGGSYSAYSSIRIAAAALAELDPEAALDWGEGLFAKIKDEVLRTAMQTWATQSPLVFAEKLAAWNAEKRPRSDRARAASVLSEFALSRAMAGEDPEIAAKWLAAGVVKPGQFTEQVALMIGRGERSFEEVYDAVAEVESHRDRVRQKVFGGMWNHLVVEQLEEAFGVLEAKPEGEARSLALASLLRETMSRDAAKMVTLLERLPAGPQREALMTEVFARSDLSRGGALLEETVGALEGRDRAVAVAAIFAGDPQISGSAVRTFHPHIFADALLSAPASEARSEGVERLALHWGGHDPEAAMEWAAGLPLEEAVAATGAAARAWAPKDAWSLADHLLESPPGRPRDAATAALVESVQGSEPDSAWAWTARIDDPPLRLETRRAVVEVWARRQPFEARTTLESADLPAGEREALQALLER